jgi:hypothetical protein
MSFKDGPYIQAACFCNLVLQDTSSALSLIRIVDTVTHTASGPQAPEEMPPFTHPLTLVVMLKSGNARGRHDLKIAPEFPSGEAQEPLISTVYFEGEEKGHNLIHQIHFVFTQEGLYWFHIFLGDEKCTSIPLRVRYHRTVTGSPRPS